MASIRCRNGETFPASHTHSSVADVRACQGAPSNWKPAPKAQSTRENAAGRSSRDARNEYLNPRGVPAQLAAFTPKNVDPMPETTTKLASQFKASRVDPELEARVPDGRYAVERDGAVRFYRVRKVTQGHHAGRTFVDMQAGDERFPVYAAASRTKILAAIADDVKAAAVRYGMELGACSQCGRTLTNPESIAAGIGPVCLSRL